MSDDFSGVFPDYDDLAEDAPLEVPELGNLAENAPLEVPGLDMVRRLSHGQRILVVDMANYFTRMADVCLSRSHVPPEARTPEFQRDAELEAVQQGIDDIRATALVDGFVGIIFVTRRISSIHPEVFELPDGAETVCTPLYKMLNDHRDTLASEHGISTHLVIVSSTMRQNDFTRRSLDDIVALWIHHELNQVRDGCCTLLSCDHFRQFRDVEVEGVELTLFGTDWEEQSVGVFNMRVQVPRQFGRHAERLRAHIPDACDLMTCDRGSAASPLTITPVMAAVTAAVRPFHQEGADNSSVDPPYDPNDPTARQYYGLCMNCGAWNWHDNEYTICATDGCGWRRT